MAFVVAAGTPEDEAAMVAEEVQRLHEQQGVDYTDVACLFR